MAERWSTFEAFLREAQNQPLEQRQALVSELLKVRPSWPWVDGKQATFIYARPGANKVAINLDTINNDPPFVQMENLQGTSLWYVTIEFSEDDLLDYMVVVNDPMTPLATEKNLLERVKNFWQIDPYNPTRISAAQMDVSVLRMKKARPFPDWSKIQRVTRGKVTEHQIDSKQLSFSGRKVWVYTPPDYDESDTDYPLLILSDGQWAIGPLQIPPLIDVLIKHKRMKPAIVAMVQSGDQSNRIKTLLGNDRYYHFVLLELLPFLQAEYRVNSEDLGIGGVGVGAVAAAHAALKNPTVFSRLIMLSPPLGKGQGEERLRELILNFEKSETLPNYIFHSIGRYEQRSRFYLPSLILRSIAQKREDTNYKFVEVGSGHSLVAFRSMFPEALSWTFPSDDIAEV